MADSIVPIALPITFSKVCEVVNQDLVGTNGRHLFGAGGQFAIATGIFNPTYVGNKDRLSNFRGYQNTVYTEWIDFTTSSTSTGWTPGGVSTSGGTLIWTFTGGYTATQTANYPVFNMSTNTGVANGRITNVNGLGTLQMGSLSIISMDYTNYTDLTDIVLTDTTLSSVLIGNKPSLTYINILNSPSLTNINTTQCPLLTTLYLQNNGITSIDFSLNPELITCWINGNNFSSTLTNQLLANLVANNKQGGNLRYKNNETGQGITDRATLINRFWTITNYAT